MTINRKIIIWGIGFILFCVVITICGCVFGPKFMANYKECRRDKEMKEVIFDATYDHIRYSMTGDYVMTISGDCKLKEKEGFSEFNDDTELWKDELLGNIWANRASAKKIVVQLVNAVDLSYLLVDCMNCENVDFTDTDFSSVRSIRGMYKGTRNIQDFGLAEINTASIEDMRELFSYSKYSDLNLSFLDTSHVKSMSLMFSYAEIDQLDISKFDTSNVINMIGMFENANISNTDLSGFDTSQVVNMSSMFMCSYVSGLHSFSFDTSHVVNMSYMFADYGKSELDVTNFDFSNVTDIQNMFSGSSAESILVNSTWKEELVDDTVFKDAGVSGVTVVEGINY